MSEHAPSCNQRYEPRAQCSCGVDPTGALCREIDRLRAELAEQERVTRCLEGALKGEQDRIARVRTVCANPPVPSRMLIPYIHAALERNQP